VALFCAGKRKIMAKRRFGSFMMLVGLLLLAATGWLVISNIRTDTAAAQSNIDILSQILAAQASDEPLNSTSDSDNQSSDISARSGRLAGETGVSTPSAAVSAMIPRSIANYLSLPTAEMPTVSVYGRKYIGVLSIPALGLELSVMDSCDDRAMDISPGCFSGSAYNPGFVIGGHNYVSHFGRLNRLRSGNIIVFTDMNGVQFRYKVNAVEVIKDTAVEDLISDVWDLSLFTCTFSGNERLVVRCLISDN
jgi:sortase A